MHNPCRARVGRFQAYAAVLMDRMVEVVGPGPSPGPRDLHNRVPHRGGGGSQGAEEFEGEAAVDATGGNGSDGRSGGLRAQSWGPGAQPWGWLKWWAPGPVLGSWGPGEP